MDVSLKTQQKQDASSHDLYSPEERKRKKGRKRRRKTAREKWTIYYQTHFITNATEAVSYCNFSRVRCFKNCFEQKLLGAILTFSFSKTVKSRFYSILMFPLSRPIYNKISFVFQKFNKSSKTKKKKKKEYIKANTLIYTSNKFNRSKVGATFVSYVFSCNFPLFLFQYRQCDVSSPYDLSCSINLQAESPHYFK